MLSLTVVLINKSITNTFNLGTSFRRLFFPIFPRRNTSLWATRLHPLPYDTHSFLIRFPAPFLLIFPAPFSSVSLGIIRCTIPRTTIHPLPEYLPHSFPFNFSKIRGVFVARIIQFLLFVMELTLTL
ncbi:hypothetical protein V8G54_026465 [Vigna mungo]|uniref:Uncharacterized protein n=1 Tax=Vigna mungo TaxID=3915 RepID=A0AAQ3N132_VIGMU